MSQVKGIRWIAFPVPNIEVSSHDKNITEISLSILNIL